MLPNAPTITHSSRPVSVLSALSLPGMLGNLWGHRDLIRQFIGREVTSRNKGTTLGMAWSVISPLLLLAVYVFVFGSIMKVRWSAGTAEEPRLVFALTIFCGMMVFSMFSEPVIRSASLIVNASTYVKKVVFPIEILPVVIVGAQAVIAGIGMVLLVVAWALTGGKLSLTVLLLPLVVLPLLAGALGLAWFLAALGVFLRDIAQIVGLIVGQILLFLTTVLYPLESVPESFRPIVALNPVTTVIDNARSVMLWGKQPDWAAWAVTMVVGLAVMQLGYAFFVKSKRGFADVL